MSKNDFIIRVYGIYINKSNQLLLSDEVYKGHSFTKFPGGGLEKGEGPVDCLKREFLEEMDLEISIQNHFYTTDFYQPSAFDKSQQIISIYYMIRADDSEAGNKIAKANATQSKELNFKWIDLEKLKDSDLTFPIDKKVVELLAKKQHPSGV